MLNLTYLGWQSWLVESETAAILIDPILEDTIGRGPSQMGQSFLFWPPRQTEWTQLPPIDAVFLTHEHEDHFHIPSLAQLDRAVPIHYSSRSSIAAATILEEMGFTPVAISHGDIFAFGELTFQFFAGNPLDGQSDEWDTLGFLIHHQNRHGAFFSNVDIGITAQMAAAVDALSAAPETPIATAVFSKMALSFWPQQGEAPKPIPNLGLTCQEDLLRESEPVRLRPGQVVHMAEGRFLGLSANRAFIHCPPEPQWPTRPRFWPKPEDDLQPVTGNPVCTPAEQQRLEEELQALARGLYGSSLFRKLMALTPDALDGRHATFLWLLLVDEEEHCVGYRYCPRSCRFVRVDLQESHPHHFAGVLTCWATDLLALFQGFFEPRAMVRSWRESWVPMVPFRFMPNVLWMFFHPLRHPQRTLAQYRAKYASLEQASPAVQASAKHRTHRAVPEGERIDVLH